MGGPKQRLDLLLVGDVDVDVRRVIPPPDFSAACPVATELLDDLGAGLVVNIAENDLCALCCDPAAGRQPDPRAPSGDDGHPARDPSCRPLQPCRPCQPCQLPVLSGGVPATLVETATSGRDEDVLLLGERVGRVGSELA